MFSTEIVGPTLYTTTTYGAAIDTGDGSALTGQWVKFTVTNVLALPNCKLILQSSQNAVDWFDNSTWDGSGNGGSPLVNTIGSRYILFQTANRYWRFGIIFYANDPSNTGQGSGNSSSSSGQSAVSSSSNGGTAAIVLAVGLVPSRQG